MMHLISNSKINCLKINRLSNGTSFAKSLCNKEVTMAHRKQPERRTFIQDRFDILIKRQKSGKATFNELTELDDIVNRDPELREKVIRESILMQDINGPGDALIAPEKSHDHKSVLPARQNMLTRIKALLDRIFMSKMVTVKSTRLTFSPDQIILI